MQQIDQITLQGYQIEKYDQQLNGDEFKVYKAKIVQTGELVALKEQSKITISEENLLRLQQCIKQQHIIEIKIFEIQESRVFVIIEKMKKSLHEYIFENEFKHKQQIEKCLLFLQIVQAIQEFHRFGIFHRNLKPINFAVCEYQNNQIKLKLLDFGLVQFMKCEDLNKSFEIGSIEYLAPEILDNEYYDKSVDVWSLGVIWYQMLTGNMIFKANNKMLTQESIYQLIEQNGNQIDRNIQNLIKQMLVIKSQERISLDLLIYYLQMYCQNRTNTINLQIQQQSISDQLCNFKIQLQEKLQQQFQEELQQFMKQNQISMKKAKIDIIQDEINQTIQNLLFMSQQEFNIYQINTIQEQGIQSYLEKWQKRDDQFMQFQQQYYDQINKMILNQEKNIEQRWETKKNEISREITLQIKQQLLLDYNLQMSIKENQIRGEQTNFTAPETLQQQIIQYNKKQLDLLIKQLDNSLIKTQKYNELKNKLIQIQGQQDSFENQSLSQIVERNRKFQKQLINIKIEVDSFEKEIELEYLTKKLQRGKIVLENQSCNLFKDYSITVEDQIKKLEELQTQNQNNKYFNDKIQKLVFQKQNLNQQFQQLFQTCQNQQIEYLLPLIQKIQFFNENLIKITNFIKQSTLQLNSQSMINQTQIQIYIQSQSNLQQQIEDIINQSFDLFGLLQAYLQTAEIQCTDINIINDQQNNIKNLLETLNQQSDILLECQRQLQENQIVIEEQRKYFIEKDFYNQRYSIFSEDKYEEFAFKLKEIINLKEMVRARLQIFEDIEFYKRIIDQFNGIKSKKEELQQVFQEVTEQIQSYNNDQLQTQIDKIKVLIIQIKLALKTIPSLNQLQRFNEEYKQNQISYLELFTLIIYIKQYNCQRYLNRYLSLKNKTLIKYIQQSQNQSQVQFNQQNQLNLDIQLHKQESQRIQSLMKEYLQCIKRQREPFDIAKLQEDDEQINKQNQIFENKITQIIKVKLKTYLNDQNLINEIIKNQLTFEFQPLLFYKKLSQWNN